MVIYIYFVREGLESKRVGGGGECGYMYIFLFKRVLGGLIEVP